MDKIKQNREELENKEKKQEKIKKEIFDKALRDLIEKKYDLSSETVKKLLQLKLNLSSSELKEMLKNSDLIGENKDFDINQINELKSDLDSVKNFQEKFIKNSENLNEDEQDDNDDISEIFPENDGKLVTNLFSSSFIKSAKSGKILPGIIVGTTNSGEKIVKLGAGITIGFLTSFYDIYQIISGKGEYKRKI